jgi:hypothetical protein
MTAVETTWTYSCVTGHGAVVSDNRGQLNQSTQHHLIGWSANTSLGEPIYLADAAKT